MIAPNKIYLSKFPEEDGDNEYGIYEEWSLSSIGEAENTEFIRKDALLEWAKEVHDSGPIKDSADKGDAWSIGYLCGMRDIIDKLNSL